MKWLEFAFRNVWRNRRRSLVTILIAALGAYSLLTSAGFGLWTYEALKEASTRENGHLVLSHPAFFQREEEVSMQFGLEDYQGIQRSVASDPRIKNFLPRIQFSGLVSNGDKSAIYLGTGVEPDEFSIKGPFLTMRDGRVLNASSDVPEVMLGKDLAASMGAKIGSSLTLLATTAAGALNAVDVQVVGIFSVGVPEVDKRALYSTIGTAQDLLGTKKVSTLSLFLDDTESTLDVMEAIHKKLPELGIKPWWELAFYYESVKALYNRLFGVIGCIMLVLVFFSVYNTMSMTVIERTRETGTLAALGAYPGELVRNFLLEAFVIGLIGVAIGMAGAALTSVILDHANVQMPPPPGRSTGYPLLIRKPLD
ncbi:MAG TPA: FtsX-like permease family protein, partial [Pseudomonadales bacterium]|nr:FtsX-like permease family protein [Pseudomonadales bacterium]